MTETDLLLIGVFIAVLAVPWIVGRLFAGANRHILFKHRRDDAFEALGTALEFEIEEPDPKVVIDSIVVELDLPRKPKLVQSTYYIGDVTDDQIVIVCGDARGDRFRAILHVAPDAEGTIGTYFLIEVMEYEGIAAPARQIHDLEALVVAALESSFPSILLKRVPTD